MLNGRPPSHVYLKALKVVNEAVEIGRRQIDLINDGYSDPVVLTETRKTFPNRATEKTVRWYRHKVNVIRRWHGQPTLPSRGITG